MLINNHNDKTNNVIIYFVESTKFCGKTKLFKLIYFLDFEHFSRTGKSVTGLDYFAWPKGPVPVELFEKINQKDDSLTKDVSLSEKIAANGKRMNVFEPKSTFDPKLFSKRELSIMQALAEEYSNSYADNMIEATHLENLPWHQIYEVEDKKQELIPYELSLKKGEFELAKSLAIENREFVSNYK